MRQLHEKVNIIPIIAKADMLTPEECSRFKKLVRAMDKVFNLVSCIVAR